jgi:hypothetical protein
MEYVDPGASFYDARYCTRVVDNLHCSAKAFGFVLQPHGADPWRHCFLGIILQRQLLLVSPVRGYHRRYQAEIPLIDLFKLARQALYPARGPA